MASRKSHRGQRNVALTVGTNVDRSAEEVDGTAIACAEPPQEAEMERAATALALGLVGISDRLRADRTPLLIVVTACHTGS